MEKILVSSCLMGHQVRYNASCLALDNADKTWLSTVFEIVTLCPEVSAGLPTPRAPAEIWRGAGEDVLLNQAQVVANDGTDVTQPFVIGAYNVLKLCQEHQIRYAILAENSPSCGSGMIYDGTFSGNKVSGRGVTAALLAQHSIKVFSQHSVMDMREQFEASKEERLSQ